jgi:hypothetical protein
MDEMTVPASVVAALVARVEQLEFEVREVRSGGQSTSGPSTAVRWPEGEGPRRSVGRRSLLLGAGAAAGIGAVTAIGGGQPAAATPGQPLVVGAVNTAGGASTELSGRAPDGVLRIGNDTTNDAGADGLYAHAQSGRGVFGDSVDGPGVFGQSEDGPGVEANGVNGNGLEARTTVTSDNPFNAVYATTRGTGNGVFGEATRTNAAANGVLGIARGTGNSVFGFKPGGVAGDAVVGYSQTTNSRGVLGLSTNGRGGAFSGKQAQVQLLASTATTHPSSGARGDLFVDNSGRLWFCKGGTTWRQLA